MSNRIPRGMIKNILGRVSSEYRRLNCVVDAE
jgi:hypothetical protein